LTSTTWAWVWFSACLVTSVLYGLHVGWLHRRARRKAGTDGAPVAVVPTSVDRKVEAGAPLDDDEQNSVAMGPPSTLNFALLVGFVIANLLGLAVYFVGLTLQMNLTRKTADAGDDDERQPRPLPMLPLGVCGTVLNAIVLVWLLQTFST